MRSIVCAAISLSFLTIAGVLAAPACAADDPLFTGRGFILGACFKHAAIRQCKGKPLHCTLEVFPRRNSSLVFEASGANASLIPGNQTVDYGRFTFRLLQFRDSVPIVEVLDIERIPLEKWEAIQDSSPTAHNVPCPQGSADVSDKR